ncbi:mitochondrial carrier protein-like protein rim2 [Aaosphaeria arxii CBS 175.79]|uniref:Mitochondrial carrier protein-like protein rim2 n=1 Tax=Aaosphaeria arxii CBS 175.79 TaxID=1450172 RepID=A0A6A5Y8J5_9PLEO|nr:mitochondrial carrier protein-like protein rim2 [Aaosphaeria arxii CBS 175.79]KAF2021728.1 mitochondrial carrier protein-like protein rim2 [Aaosphaeria arxii CBS 175.79]
MTVEHAEAPRSLRASSAQFKQTLTQSRETGDVIPPKQQDGSTISASATPFAKSWAHFIAGGLGGMASATLTAPLDVLKTRLQSTYYQHHLVAQRSARGLPPIETMSLARSSLLHIRETGEILFQVPKVEGWRALFKGLGPNLIGVVPARAINFYVYGNGKRIISTYGNNGQEAAWVHLGAAACAGIVTGTATNPIWLVKTRLQLDKATHADGKGRQYKNAFDCTMQTIRKEGISGLYRGLTASYLGVTESTLQWMLYEQMKLSLARREERVAASGRAPTVWDQTVSWTGKLSAAGAAKFVAALLTYPHEVVRTRLRQAPLENGHLKYTGLAQCFKLIWKEEGMAALYGGLVPHMLRVVPSAAIMFGTYEGVLKLLGTSSNM